MVFLTGHFPQKGVWPQPRGSYKQWIQLTTRPKVHSSPPADSERPEKMAAAAGVIFSTRRSSLRRKTGTGMPWKNSSIVNRSTWGRSLSFFTFFLLHLRDGQGETAQTYPQVNL